MKAGLCTSGVVVFAVIATGFPDPFLYDRAALGEGELWRLATGHLVHFGKAHLLFNLIVTVPALWILERIDRVATLWSVLLLSVVLGGALYGGDPALAAYGGLSGLACALLVILGGSWLLHRPTRWAGTLLLAGVLVKLVAVDLPAFFEHAPLDPAAVQRCARAHLFGALLGGLVWAGGWTRRRPNKGPASIPVTAGKRTGVLAAFRAPDPFDLCGGPPARAREPANPLPAELHVGRLPAPLPSGYPPSAGAGSGLLFKSRQSGWRLPTSESSYWRGRLVWW